MIWTKTALFWLRDLEWLMNRPLTSDSNRENGDDLGDAKRRKLFGGDGGKAVMGDIGTWPECKTRSVESIDPRFTVLVSTRSPHHNYGGGRGTLYHWNLCWHSFKMTFEEVNTMWCQWYVRTLDFFAPLSQPPSLDTHHSGERNPEIRVCWIQ